MDADRLIKEADVALYRAKAEGGDRYRFFEPGMDQALAVLEFSEDGNRDALEQTWRAVRATRFP